MKPFVINRHGRLVFPANFLGDLISRSWSRSTSSPR